MGLPAKVSGVVTFVATLWLFWWSFPLSSAFFFVKWLYLWGHRQDIFEWSKFMVTCLGTKVRLAGERRIFTSSKPVMYLSNHRSWGDFFLDVYILGGRAMIMSRMAVFYAFPAFMSPVVVLKGILLFKRNISHDKQVFNKWLDEKRAESQLSAMLVYPEGHRSTKPDPLPLKRGMLHYAHSRKMTVQICVSVGKEDVLSEKRLSVGIGREVVTSFSEPIDASDYKDSAAFIAKVTESFASQWKVAFAARAQSATLPIYSPEDEVEKLDYPMSMRLQMLALLFTCLAALAAMIGATLYVLGTPTCAVLGLVVALAIAHNAVQKPTSPAKSKAA